MLKEIRDRLPASFFSKEHWIVLGLAALFIASIAVNDTEEGSDLRYQSWNGMPGNSPSVAVVPLYGEIGGSNRISGEAEIDVIRRSLEKVADDDRIKGVILRVNSFGGTVASSQELYSDILAFKKESQKPVVVSIVDAGVSGAYWASLAGDRIFAQPGSYVGGMGVVLQHMDLQDVPKEYGVDVQTYKSGLLKDMFNPWRRPTQKERIIINRMLQNVHRQFVDTVVDARQIEDKDARTLADGRIYTGEQALEQGLIDELGGLRDATEYLRKAAGLTETPDVLWMNTNYFSEFLSSIRPPSASLSILSEITSQWSRSVDPR